MESMQSSAVESALGSGAVRSRPRPSRYGAWWSVVLFAADLLSFGAAIAVANVLVRGSVALIATQSNALQAVAFATFLWIVLFERIGMYRRSFSTTARDEVYASLAACAMAMSPALALFLVMPALVPFRHFLIVTLALTAVGVGASRFTAAFVRAHVLPLRTRRIAVVGTPERVASVPNDLSLTGADSVVRLPVDDFDDDVAAVMATGDLLQFDWLRCALEREVDEVIVTEALPPELMPALLRLLEARGIKLAFAPMRIRPHACDFTVRRDGGLALLYPRSLAICRPGAEAARRAFDLLLTVPAVVVLAPLFVAAAIAVRLDSAGPIFYLQRRVGRRGRSFDIIKFRTMRPNAEAVSGPVWATAGEARTTRIGKYLRRTSLDELPQLFNVLRGDMSLVGPRPERPFYVEQFRKILPRYDERHLVRPGITGWSHVNMARNVDPSAIGERLSYDLFYLEHWSVFMDVLILAKTGAEFLFHAVA